MGIDVDIDGFGNLSLEFLVSDLNGTLSMYGTVFPSVKQLIAQLTSKLEIYIVTADTLQTGHAILLWWNIIVNYGWCGTGYRSTDRVTHADAKL